MISDSENQLLRGVRAKAGTASAIVCHIGAREHYGVARALHRKGQLKELITDIWVQPSVAASGLPVPAARRLWGRYHSELSKANVTHFTANSLIRAAAASFLKPKSNWEGVAQTNAWFQTRAARRVDEILGTWSSPQQPVVIAYSYAALQILEIAHRHGARTVLCQIDGGEADARLIERIAACKEADTPDNPPPSYWANWHRECAIADRIVVNSDWSRSLLAEAAVPIDKISVIPVIYQHEAAVVAVERKLPAGFNKARPLRALFLGALTMRKGIDEVLAAARAVVGEPIEFHLVGADREGRGEAAWAGTNIKRHGHAPRAEVGKHYREADVFLFPTHSDGFGLTQLEAMSEGLPVIASRNCAVLVKHELSGILLNDVSGGALADALRYCLADPARLARMGVAARAAAGNFAGTNADRYTEVFLDAADTI